MPWYGDTSKVTQWFGGEKLGTFSLEGAVVAGGAAGNITVTGIATADVLVKVLHFSGFTTAESRNALLSDPGLRIDGGSGAAIAETQTGFYALANGTLVNVAAATNMPALAGTVTNGQFGVYMWSVDSAGTLTQSTLATGASLAAITFPAPVANKAVVGAVIINPTGTGDFVGGTTNLDDGTVVPNAVFLDGNDISSGLRTSAGDVGLADLTSEFTITAGNTINNNGGTVTSGGQLLVLWARGNADIDYT